jgi:hypothetical protein
MNDAEAHIHVLSARKTIFRFCRKISLGFWYPRHFLGPVVQFIDYLVEFF